jgi:hypothetical protein
MGGIIYSHLFFGRSITFEGLHMDSIRNQYGGHLWISALPKWILFISFCPKWGLFRTLLTTFDDGEHTHDPCKTMDSIMAFIFFMEVPYYRLDDPTLNV